MILLYALAITQTQPPQDFVAACWARAKTQAELNFCTAGEKEAKELAVVDREAVVCFDREMSQMGMNQCASEAYDRADKALNTTYSEARNANKGDAKGLKTLLDSQRGWLRYRAGQCDLEADEFRGGSIVPLVSGNCMTRITRERTQELRDYLAGPEGQ